MVLVRLLLREREAELVLHVGLMAVSHCRDGLDVVVAALRDSLETGHRASCALEAAHDVEIVMMDLKAVNLNVDDKLADADHGGQGLGAPGPPSCEQVTEHLARLVEVARELEGVEGWGSQVARELEAAPVDEFSDACKLAQ